MNGWDRRLASVAGLLLSLVPGTLPASRAVREGVPGPEFRLRKLGGGQVALRDLRGKPVLLAFWLPGCPGCNVEAPHLQALNRKYSGKGLQVFGIAGLYGPVVELHDFVRRHGIRYPTLVDPEGKTTTRYGVGTYPRTVLIDRSGKIRFIQSGFRPGNERLLEQRVQAIL